MQSDVSVISEESTKLHGFTSAEKQEKGENMLLRNVVKYYQTTWCHRQEDYKINLQCREEEKDF
jgi:hypothetical protein